MENTEKKEAKTSIRVDAPSNVHFTLRVQALKEKKKFEQYIVEVLAEKAKQIEANKK